MRVDYYSGQAVFDIEFITDEPEELDEGEDAWIALRGRTTLGDHREEFYASLGHWSRADYERHWLEAARRLVGGADRTGFFTSAFQFWWVMWRAGDFVFVGQQLIVAETLHAPPFDAADPYRHVPDRDIEPDEDGHVPSEWRLTLGDLRAFVERREVPYVPA